MSKKTFELIIFRDLQSIHFKLNRFGHTVK